MKKSWYTETFNAHVLGYKCIFMKELEFCLNCMHGFVCLWFIISLDIFLLNWRRYCFRIMFANSYLSWCPWLLSKEGFNNATRSVRILRKVERYVIVLVLKARREQCFNFLQMFFQILIMLLHNLKLLISRVFMLKLNPVPTFPNSFVKSWQ